MSLNLRFEVFTAVTMKNGVFWDVTTFFDYFNWLIGLFFGPGRIDSIFLGNVGEYPPDSTMAEPFGTAFVIFASVMASHLNKGRHHYQLVQSCVL
jgi:hypothetical protein